MTIKTNHMESLEKAITREEHKCRMESERESKREQKLKIKEKVAIKKEEKYSKEKTVLADYIFSWAKEFLQTKTYSRLCKLSSEDTTLIIFCGGWGHELPYDTSNEHDWGEIYLEDDGTFCYTAGSSFFMGSTTEVKFPVKTPEELKNKLCYAYLKEFVETIETGKIYGQIKDRNLF